VIVEAPAAEGFEQDGVSRAGNRGTPASRDLRVWVLTAALWVCTGALYFLAVRHLSPVAAPLGLAWWMLAPAFAAAEVFVAHVRYRREVQTYSLSEVPLLIGLCFCTPAALIVARIVGAAVALAGYRRQSGVKLTFNLGLFALLDACVAPLIFFAILGGDSPLSLRGWLAAFVAITCTDVLSDLAITLVVVLREGRVPMPEVRRDLAYGLLVALTNTCIGLVAVILLWNDPWSLVLLLAVTGIVYLAYRGYVSLSRMYSRVARLYAFTSWSGGTLASPRVCFDLLERLCDVMGAEYAELVLDDAEGRPIQQWIRDGDEEVMRALDVEGASPELQPDEHCVLLKAGDGAVPARLRRAGMSEVLTTALRDGDVIIGAVLVGSRSGRVAAFERRDEKIFDTLANHVSVALKNTRLVTRLREEVAERQYQALHEPLTGLPNRRAFVADAGAEVGEAVDRGESRTLFLVDLDELRRVNETLGHDLGDQAIVEAGRRLCEVPGMAHVAHLGGDEFVLVGPGGTGADAVRVAEEVQERLALPVLLGDCTVQLGASIGIVFAPEHAERVEQLLQKADIAAEHAKALPQGIQVFDRSLDRSGPRQLSLARDLSQAIESGALSCQYQPQVRIADGGLAGAEVLARWTHPSLGVITPAEFVPIAESSGAIRRLTEQILRRALHEAAGWLRADADFRLSLNVSVRCLHYPTLAMDLRQIVDEAGFVPRQIVLEITVSSLMADVLKFVAAVERLSVAGFGISIDDFGVGFSSLAYLQLLPVGELKIDRQFMRDLLADAGKSYPAMPEARFPE
jgi:diguanylate cyclase (GGDEF)-like protein